MAEGLEDIYSKITDLQAQLEAYKPLPPDVEGKIMQKLRLDWNYHSNAIEGNKLTYGETIAFLMEGLTAKGKPLKDHLDIRGHNEAINFLMDMVKQNRPLTESDIRGIHAMILVESYESDARTADGIPTKKRIALGKYKEMPNHVKTVTGEIHYYATPEETPAKMQELVAWYNEANANNKFHALELAARFHHRFTAIHPFDDGNGRLGRILMNLILLQHHLPPIIVKQEDRSNYYSVLNQADNGIHEPLMEYLGNLLIHSLEIYLRGAKGESIEEPSDLDKEIALFKKEYAVDDLFKESKNGDAVRLIMIESIAPLVDELYKKSTSLNELFRSYSDTFKYGSNKGAHPRTYGGEINTLRNEIKNTHSNELNEVVNFNFNYIWRAFKKSAIPFDCNIHIQIQFKKYNYIILYGNNLDHTITKLYHEQLSLIEINTIVINSIKNVMNYIKKASSPND